MGSRTLGSWRGLPALVLIVLVACGRSELDLPPRSSNASPSAPSGASGSTAGASRPDGLSATGDASSLVDGDTGVVERTGGSVDATGGAVDADLSDESDDGTADVGAGAYFAGCASGGPGDAAPPDTAGIPAWLVSPGGSLLAIAQDGAGDAYALSTTPFVQGVVTNYLVLTKYDPSGIVAPAPVLARKT